jgi:hypothetical protein
MVKMVQAWKEERMASCNLKEEGMPCQSVLVAVTNDQHS